MIRVEVYYFQSWCCLLKLFEGVMEAIDLIGWFLFLKEMAIFLYF